MAEAFNSQKQQNWKKFLMAEVSSDLVSTAPFLLTRLFKSGRHEKLALIRPLNALIVAY
jgi:hypothetical protein